MFDPSRSGGVVADALLEAVLAEAAERFACVDQIAFFQETEPKIQIHNLPISGIESLAGVGSTEHDGGRFADQVRMLHQAPNHNVASGMQSIGERFPRIDHGGAFVQDCAGAGSDGGLWICVQHLRHFPQGVGARQSVIAKKELDVLAASLGKAIVPILDHADILWMDFHAQAFVASGEAFEDFG